MPPGPKPGSTPRRVSSSLSKVSTPPTTALATAPSRAAKSSKASRIVHFKLPRDQLQRFPHEQHIRKASHAKTSPLSTSKVITSEESTPSAAVKPDPDSTSTTNGHQDSSSSPVKDTKSEALPSSKSGTKREAGPGDEGDEKEKAKTNPRKRPKP